MEKLSILDIPAHKLTPGMRQYQDAKKANPDCIIFLRMGDFYELFYEDAVIAAKDLEITLTSRGKGEKKAPLAGIPYHALETYLGKLVKKGHKVAIVEQLENPKEAKGLVKRGLVRIVTPGTVMESTLLQEKENNYLMGLTAFGDKFAAALCDLSTGEFFTLELNGLTEVTDKLVQYQPKECIIPQSLIINIDLVKEIKKQDCFLTPFEDYYFKKEKAKEILLNHFEINSLTSFGLEENSLNIAVSGALLEYLTKTQKNSLLHIKKISLKSNLTRMVIDSSTYRNLELVKNIKDGSNKGSLISVLDQTVTSMGGRLFKKWLKSPLLKKESIEARQLAISNLKKETILREEIREKLKQINDIERLISKINYGNANPRDLISLRYSLQRISPIKEKLKKFASPLLSYVQEMADLEKVNQLISRSIKDEPNISLREGNIIKKGYNEELDRLQAIKTNSKKYLQELEGKEKEKTGISSLKISYNRVFGYFIEVTKRNISQVPSHYIRKQTTANSERYITEELKQEEEKILGAQDKIVQLEFDLFQKINQEIIIETGLIQDAASRLAILDVLCSLAKVAFENGYVKPQFVDENYLQIKEGRHPVVEKIEQKFIPNDVLIKEGEIMIITGPNTSGKSTIMRQTALIVLMAQIGSYVPASEVTLSIFDRIFTRVGAYDDLSSGQSTFMVEMLETASILNNASKKSLLILDEVGRGTSTFDGVAIAWSVVEYLHDKVKAKTMFATHYHVLNKLSEKFSRVKNYNVAVKEVEGDLIFLRRLVEGGTDQSHGVHVARMAGLPEEVVQRAKEIQEILEKEEEMSSRLKVKKVDAQSSLLGFK